VRVEPGIYRLARFPQSAEEQLVIYTLWPRRPHCYSVKARPGLLDLQTEDTF
jgi:hypothetical protein